MKAGYHAGGSLEKYKKNYRNIQKSGGKLLSRREGAATKNQISPRRHGEKPKTFTAESSA
jgi:hypothetical protein